MGGAPLAANAVLNVGSSVIPAEFSGTTIELAIATYLTSGGMITGTATNGATCSATASTGDCPGKVPCACRSSGTEMTPNSCLVGSSCNTDADCGACGFCSLGIVPAVQECMEADHGSQCSCVGVTSEAYACHMPDDECTSDVDCGGGTSYCSYSEAETRWTCNVCPPRPIHP